MTTKLALVFVLSFAIIAGVDKLASFTNVLSLPGAHGSVVGSSGRGIISGPDSSNLPFSLDGSHHRTEQKRSLSGSYRSKRSVNDYIDDEELGEDSKSGFGVIGCKFSKELCDTKTEWCFDDYVFGRCLNIYEPPEPSQLYRYQLTKEDTHVLEREMERLYSLGYRWAHAYTQCVLQILLDAVKLGINLDTTPCSPLVDQDLEGAMKAFEDEIDPSGLAFVKFKPSDTNPHPDFADELYQPPILQSMSPGSAVVEELDGPFSISFLESWGGRPRVDERKKPSLKAQLNSIPQRQMSAVKAAQEEAELAEAIANQISGRRFQKKSDYLPAEEDQLLSNTRWLDNPTLLNAIEDPESLAFLQALTESAAAGDLLEDMPEPSPRKIVGDPVNPLETKIFSQVYNTPSLFRRGVETRDGQIHDDNPVFLEGPVPEPEVDLLAETLPIPMALQEELPELSDGQEEDIRFQHFLQDSDDMDSNPEPTSHKPLYTEGGAVYLNNPKRQLLLDLEAMSDGRLGRGFERQERLDVKKPGPWYPSVNNYAFDYDHRHPNPEFQGGEGPADMQRQDDSALPRDNEPDTEQRDVVSRDDEKVERSANMLEKKSGTNYILGLGDRFELTDDTFVNVLVSDSLNYLSARQLLDNIALNLEVSPKAFSKLLLNADKDMVTFHVNPNKKELNASEVAKLINESREKITTDTGVGIQGANVGLDPDGPFSTLLADTDVNRYIFLSFFVLILLISAGVGAAAICLIRRHSKQQEKLARLGSDDPDLESCKDYQDLCRARMAAKNNEKVEPMKAVQRAIGSLPKGSEDGSSSSRSSTSSCWKDEVEKPRSSLEPVFVIRRLSSCPSSLGHGETVVVLPQLEFTNEEPVMTNMDISTGHMVLSYMEDHLKKKDRLEQEWAALCKYEAEPCSTAIAEKPDNQKKNRYTNSLPYDHSRVVLNELANVNGTDYINASTITDHNPRNPAYIATQAPLQTTAADFWQMVWEQGSVVIVALTRISDNGTNLCHRYWPEEGSEVHHIYEVHLVSEHIWCEEYLVRSFYLKNLKTGETRTVTQFHFLAWPENGIPVSTKAILEFRRKVNKSYRGRSCPIIIHCSDGAGRSGTYCLIDMVLNRMAKGAKEIDIAATLEHIRDQRPGMVRTKQQFEFVLMAVAEEVHAILKALPQ